MPYLNNQKQTPVGDPAASDTSSAYTVEVAGQRLGGIGRTTIYGLIGSGKLVAVKLGSRTLITAASIQALLDSLPRVASKLGRRHEDAPQ